MKDSDECLAETLVNLVKRVFSSDRQYWYTLCKPVRGSSLLFARTWADTKEQDSLRRYHCNHRLHAGEEGGYEYSNIPRVQV